MPRPRPPRPRPRPRPRSGPPRAPPRAPPLAAAPCSQCANHKKASVPRNGRASKPSTVNLQMPKEREGKRTHIALLLGFRGIVDQEGIERERVGQDKVPDVVAADRERVERLRFAPANRHLDFFQVRIHRRVDTCEERAHTRTTRTTTTTTMTVVVVVVRARGAGAQDTERVVERHGSSTERKRAKTVSHKEIARSLEQHNGQPVRGETDVPVMVPLTVVPFLSSIVTVSLLSFICVVFTFVAVWRLVNCCVCAGRVRVQRSDLPRTCSRKRPRHGGSGTKAGRSVSFSCSLARAFPSVWSRRIVPLSVSRRTVVVRWSM
jgi:hypothetical protein